MVVQVKLAIVGIGNAGCRIANRILHVEKTSGRDLCHGNSLLINSKRTEFDASPFVPEDRQLLIGDIHQEVRGHGIEGDPDWAAEVARDERNEIIRAFDMIEFTDVDGVLAIAGLGGGTGGGAGAVILDALQGICDKPVYGLAVLPTESEGQERALNAARALQSFVAAADNVIVFDNEGWVDRTDGGTSGYDNANLLLARRIITLFGAGEIDGEASAETRMDPSDIMRTLDTGGISAIGYATSDLHRRGGLLSRIFRYLPWDLNGADDRDGTTEAAKINRLVRQAARSQLTIPCEVSSAERALILLSGPPRELSRKGFESSQYWLEQEADTVEVMAGDEPHTGASQLTVAVLLSNVTDVSRIEAMQRQAKAVPSPEEESEMVFEGDKIESD